MTLNRKVVSRVKCLVSVFPDIKDCPKIRNLPEIFLRTFENVGLSSKGSLIGVVYGYCMVT